MIGKLIRQLKELLSSDNPVNKSLALKMNISVILVMITITGLFAVVLVVLENKRFNSALEQTRILLQTLKESEQPALLSDIQNVEAGYVKDTALAAYTKSIKGKIKDLMDVRVISSVNGRQIAGSSENYVWPVQEISEIIPMVKKDETGRYLISDSHAIHYFTPLKQVGVVKGYLYMKFDLEPLYKASFYNFLFSFAAVIAMIFAVIAVLTYLNRLLVINPVLEISESMTAVGRGDFKKRIDLKNRDEIGLVTRSFNSMVNTLYGFTRYVSGDVVKLILDTGNVKISGKSKKVVVFFSDIRSFTTLTETNEPDELIEMLNSYFETMVPIISSCGGRLDKFIGDAIMADWGGLNSTGDDAANACRAALLQKKALVSYNESRKRDGKFTISIGMGINMGLAIAGTIGSEQKMDYTVIGDTINLGSRLEGLTKEYGAGIIVSGEIVKEAGKEFVFMELDKVAVKGKNKGVRIFELIDFAEGFSKNDRSRIKSYEEALDFYFKRKFRKTVEILKPVIAKYNDTASVRLKESAEKFIKNPPSKNWDGISVKKTK
jgi:class 3 adenylate cyclase